VIRPLDALDRIRRLCAVARDRTQQADLLRLAEHSIEADLAKRDHTINTIAQALRDGGPASGTAADAVGAGVRRGSAADAPHCPAYELSFAIDPESATAARAGSAALDRTAP
jgi:hypothetical protein